METEVVMIEEGATAKECRYWSKLERARKWVFA